MDKKNTFIGISLLVLAFGVMVWQQRNVHESMRDSEAPISVSTPVASEQTVSSTPTTVTGQGPSLFDVVQSDTQKLEASVQPIQANELYTLENEYVRVVLASIGGGHP